MASSIQRVAVSGAEASPWTLAPSTPLTLWHLFSLDAPTVAALWTWFAARATHTALPLAVPIAMFVFVWALYAADRLLDARPHPDSSDFSLPASLPSDPLEPRHRFHHTHRRAFTLIIAAAILALIPLALALPAEILRRYLILATLLAAWFALIHLFRRDQPLPKELLTGVFFASAVFTPTLTLHTLPAAVLFALLCTLNCLYIFRWEHPLVPAHTHLTTRAGLRFLSPLTILAIAAPLLVARPGPILLAESLSAALLLTLHHRRRALAPTALRAAADFVLLTPLLIAPFLR